MEHESDIISAICGLLNRSHIKAELHPRKSSGSIIDPAGSDNSRLGHFIHRRPKGNMSRRGFLQLLGIAATTVILGGAEPKVEESTNWWCKGYDFMLPTHLLNWQSVRGYLYIQKGIFFTRPKYIAWEAGSWPWKEVRHDRRAKI